MEIFQPLIQIPHLLIQKIIDFLGTPLTTEIVEEAIEGRSYTPSPKNLAYWYQQNGQFILKLNLPNIISQIASDSEQHINATIINAIIDAVSQMDAIKLKQIIDYSQPQI